MAKSLAALRKSFDQQLRDIWNEWDAEGFSGSPFKNVNESHSWWDNAGINYDLGLVTGISMVTGWSLARPKS